MLKLYNVHCGFYDKTVTGGLFEGHTNILVVADSFADAKNKIKGKSEFKRLKMHIDGIQEIDTVDGYAISLKEQPALANTTVLKRQKYGSTKAETLTFKD
ncbi:DUF1543 domain-containing protein [Bdellovibrio sp. SKB1291214]|uniref:DUF1543 domain-containing protein n=1 Tax=Bdellovibrio sp. SKB1291214 TaxID=1732569 RepID=UPI000B518D1D|nr:DUF1543 domain-containing protein [Bdellovibrio sp. SKB1291214]UYL09378.1 DUF1543 domain-containing protein [Bdellovibrio sp. SKB1291214]